MVPVSAQFNDDATQWSLTMVLKELSRFDTETRSKPNRVLGVLAVTSDVKSLEFNPRVLTMFRLSAHRFCRPRSFSTAFTSLHENPLVCPQISNCVLAGTHSQ